MAVREDLYAWLTEQEPWQQDLATRLVHQAQLEGDEYTEALAMVKGAFGVLSDGESAQPPHNLTLEELPETAVTGAPRLVGFGGLRGVGALSPEYALTFAAAGLTIVYGDNAAGKTTYVRALKRVCRAVDRDTEIRGNVFAPPTATADGPRARVALEAAGQPDEQQVDLTDPPALGLEAISVFDSECAELYLDAQNAVAFVPSELRILARLAATQDQMRGDLHTEAEALLAQAPSFPEFDADTPAKAFVTNLTAETSMDEARKLAAHDEAEKARLTELRAVVASTQAQNARADAHVARQDAQQTETLAEGLRRIEGHLATEAVHALQEKATQAATAQAAVELANKQFSGLPIAGVGGAEWQNLWNAAREFAAHAEKKFPPASGDPCPLCLQEIDSDAAGRLAHFEEHVRSSVQEDARVAGERLAGALDLLSERHIDDCRTPLLNALSEREPELYRRLTEFLDGVRERFAALRDDPTGAQVVRVPSEVIEQLKAWGATRRHHADTLLAASDPEREKELRAELDGLDARQKLGARLSDIEQWLSTLSRARALEGARRALATNRITSKQRQLSEEAVTGALDNKLQLEMAKLDCQIPVNLHPQTRVGEPEVTLRLAGARGTPRVSDIASEGEQRALSLSFFLAEIETSESDGGIIVDDPVSSLDESRREYIAKRFVTEAARRQVIVFTHDLPFMFDLVEQAEGAGLEPLVQAVWRLGSDVGRVDEHPPFKAMKLGRRLDVLAREIAQWDSQPPPRDFDDAWNRVCTFYARLRMSWERAIEERLFKGVVQRFQRAVKTLALEQVEITPELKNMVKEGMDRCSMFVHDEPPPATTSLPDRTRLSQDLEALQEFARQTRGH